jgi:hypothetical protein
MGAVSLTGFVTCVDYGLGRFPLQRFCGFTARFYTYVVCWQSVYFVKYLPNHNPCGGCAAKPQTRWSGNGPQLDLGGATFQNGSALDLYRLAKKVMMIFYTYYRIIRWTNSKEGKPISKPRRINLFQEARHGNSPWCTSPLRVLSRVHKHTTNAEKSMLNAGQHSQISLRGLNHVLSFRWLRIGLCIKFSIRLSPKCIAPANRHFRPFTIWESMTSQVRNKWWRQSC